MNSLDGLRALCILGVMLYHVGVKWMPGGLVGVTVFFIVSGYLITSGLIHEFSKNGTINLKDFWIRRVRRLMPAVVVMVVVTALLCSVFNQVLLTKMRPDIIPALTMTLNWAKIISNESYFQAAGQPSPLTSFWSLAIEWQYYVIWPPIIYLLLRCKVPKRVITTGLLVLAALSAVLMAVLYVPGEDPSRVYYGTDTRAMSILLGCWLAFVWPFRTMSQTAAADTRFGRLGIEAMGCGSIAGLVAIMVVTDGFSSFSYYGGTLLVSVLSTVAIAALIPHSSFVNRVMSLRSLVWVGQRSYSMYLWHYPIIELLVNPNSANGTPLPTMALMFALTLVASDLSYRLVEEPIRHGGFFAKLRADLATWRTRRAARKTGGREREYAARRRYVLPLGQRVMVVSVVVALVGASLGVAFVPEMTAAGGRLDEHKTTAATLKRPLTDGVYDVVLIGDSVMLAVTDQLAEAFPYGLVDAQGSRSPAEGLAVYESVRDEGKAGDTVVFACGTNWGLDQDMIDQVISEVGSDTQLWFVTMRMPDDSRDDDNQLLYEAAEKYDNVGVIDWYALSKDEDGWFSGDGIHIGGNEAGCEAYVNLIVDTLDYEPPTSENTHYAQLFLGDGVALTASDELADAFPKGAVDCGEGRTPHEIETSYAGYVEKGVVGDDVIVAVGAAEPFSGDEFVRMLDAIGTDKNVLVVNTRTTNNWCDANNSAMSEAVAGRSNVKLVDWYKASAGHDEYFSGDGTHLSDKGAKAYATLVADAVG